MLKVCKRCLHQWISRLLKAEPKSCPACKSRGWKKSRKKKVVTIPKI